MSSNFFKFFMKYKKKIQNEFYTTEWILFTIDVSVTTNNNLTNLRQVFSWAGRKS